MIERVVENWLTSATEKTFQVPFCHMLANKGYTVLHLSRHCGMELGKDVLALDPQGVPCAFQLKTPNGKRITLSDWRAEISGQVADLVMGAPLHPSIRSLKPHRSFLVTNRDIDEEVLRAIDDMNRQWARSGQKHLKLETIVGGELLDDALRLGMNLWPSELGDVKTLLELFLSDGNGPLDKDKLCELMQAVLPLGESERPSSQHCQRAMASAAVLCALATAQYTSKENHWAVIEAWTLCVAHLLAVAERWRLPQRLWKNHIAVVEAAILNSLERLLEELRDRRNLVEGDPINDRQFRGIRTTCLVGMASVYGLWQKHHGGENEFTEVVEAFCGDNSQKMKLWGEGAVPLFLAYYWYWQKVTADCAIQFLPAHLIDLICQANAPKSNPETTLPNPYWTPGDVLAERLHLSEEPREEDFRRHSYALEALVHLYTRQNWKRHMKERWPDITRVWFLRFDPKERWRFFLWRSDKGTHWTVCPAFPKGWNELRAEAAECQGKCVPTTIKKSPLLLLLFLCVCPHRLNSEVVRWLDSQLEGT